MNKKHIKFNAPYLSKFSKKNIFKVLKNNKFADGEFQKKCEVFIERKIKYLGQAKTIKYSKKDPIHARRF